jgi:nucleotide-binding universal stress UspA family protein
LSSTTLFLVAVDGSEGSMRAARFAAARARAEGARLHLLHVIEWSPYAVLTPRELETRHIEREKEIARAHAEVLEPVAREVGAGLQIHAEARHGHPLELLCEVAQEVGATQLFSGRRGRSTLKTLLFGSIAGGLVQSCPVPFTVVP